MKNAILIAGLLLGTLGFSQRPDARVVVPKSTLADTAPDAAADWLMHHTANLGGPGVGLRLNYLKIFPTSRHYAFIQTYHGIDVFGAQLKLNCDASGRIISVVDASVPVGHWPVRHTKEQRLVWWSQADGPVLCQLDTITIDGEPQLQLTDISGHIHYRQSLRTYYHVHDTPITGTVFITDPLTSAETSYGGNYQDFNDASNAQLDAELQSVTVRGEHDNGLFYLENNRIRFKDLVGSAVQPPKYATPDFSVNRSHADFEWMMIYYHLTRFHSFLEQIGCQAAIDFFVEIDAHGDFGDNSYFQIASPPRLVFGTGNVDDAEDADVIIHEYVHAISHHLAPGSNIGAERRALDEGVGDYFAASYSRSISTYQWHEIFPWDAGGGTFFAMRSAQFGGIYPDDLDDDIHRDGQIWSSALMDIWDMLGRDETDKLVLESMKSWSSFMGMDDAAALLLIANESIRNGDDHDELYQILQARGFFGERESGIGNTANAAVDLASPILYLNSTSGFSEIQIFDIRGRLVHHVRQYAGVFYVIPRSAFTSSGIYVVRVISELDEFAEKVMITR